jgi:hypothetical protein
MKYKKVETDTSFVRDMNTNAIINIDNQALHAYKLKRKANKKLYDDVEDLKSEMTEIKALLVKLINK